MILTSIIIDTLIHIKEPVPVEFDWLTALLVPLLTLIANYLMVRRQIKQADINFKKQSDEAKAQHELALQRQQHQYESEKTEREEQRLIEQRFEIYLKTWDYLQYLKRRVEELARSRTYIVDTEIQEEKIHDIRNLLFKPTIMGSEEKAKIFNAVMDIGASDGSKIRRLQVVVNDLRAHFDANFLEVVMENDSEIEEE